MPSNARIGLVVCFAACVFAAAGCQTTTVPKSILPQVSGNDPQVQLDYWHELATKELISNDEAFHGILLYLDGKDDCTTYEQRVTALKSRGYLNRSFKQPADQAVERGTVAVALAKSLNLKSSLTIRLTGYSPRYATKELMYRDIYPMSGTDQIFTGGEFVGVIGKAEDYRMGDPSNLPATQMPEPEVAQDDTVTPILAMIAPDPATLSLNPTTAGTSTQAASGTLTATITAVQGLCSVRSDENSPWKPAAVGMELSQNAEFRTGPTGTIQFSISDNQVVSVDRLTTMKLLQAVQKGGKVTTDIGIKYGRTRYDLEGGGLEHQSTLRSPNATLAVRGTKVSLFDQAPFMPQAVSLTGRAEFKAQRRRAGVAFGNRGQGKTVVNANSVNAGDLALRQSVVDPTLQGARTESEQALLTTVISRGAVIELDRDSGIPIVHGGIPPTNAELIPALPGKLNIVMRWTGDVDLNLGVSTPGTETNLQSEFVYPARGLNVSPTGKTAFDHRGGANGGIEVVYFNTVKDGLYKIAGPIITPGGTSTATLEAFLDGKPINLADLGTLTITPVVTQSIDVNNPALAILAINAPLPFGGQPAKTAARSTFSRESLKLMGPMPIAPVIAKKPANAAAVAARALPKK